MMQNESYQNLSDDEAQQGANANPSNEQSGWTLRVKLIALTCAIGLVGAITAITIVCNQKGDEKTCDNIPMAHPSDYLSPFSP